MANTKPSTLEHFWRRASQRLEMMTLIQLNRGRHFRWQGENYQYCVDEYNSTWHNERTVEVPIARMYLTRYGGEKTLEVGNVLAHYGAIEHDVVDKYEQGPGVTNVDVVDYRPPHCYDLIISVSTLEHAGWDEDVVEETKPLRAVDHLISLLAPGGRLFVTFPFGWNPHVDTALREQAFRLDAVSFLKRTSRLNHWREVPRSEIGEPRYGHPFPAANVIAIGVATADAAPPAAGG